MDRRRRASEPLAAPPDLDDEPGEGDDAAAGEPAPAPPSLDGLPVLGISRRRTAWALGAIVTVWIIWVFVRQVGSASAATARADAIRDENATLQGQVTALQAEMELIQKQAYIEQQARGYALGTPRERPFSLPANAPTPGPDAPGSAGARLGAQDARVTPLESWLSLLFGPPPGR
ncbi:MAG TPA: hypothetical protein VIV06_06710 [Candidatus Limnocylindrales bacterium]